MSDTTWSKRSPEYKARRKAHNHQRYLELRDTPEFQAKQRERYLKSRTNPARRAQVRAAVRRWTAQQKRLDPAGYAAMRATNHLKAKRNAKTRSPIPYRDFTLVQYLSLLAHQDQRCAICKAVFEDAPKKRALDHDHKTNQIRGILCTSCNFLLGHAKDNPRILMAAIRYLEEPRC